MDTSLPKLTDAQPGPQFPQLLNVPGVMSLQEYRQTYSRVMRRGAEKINAWIDSSTSARQLSRPTVSVVLGSGLGGLVGQVEVLGELPFSEVSLPKPSAVGHAGKFILGALGNRVVLLQSGRLHCFESWHPAVVALSVRMQALAGITTFILTNAAGSLDVNVPIGSVVALTGDRGAQGHSPSSGLYDDEEFDGPFGPKFHPVNELYDSTLRAKFIECAQRVSLTVQQGVYQFMPGPRYEQVGEIKEFVRLRKEAIAAGDSEHALITVGMSTAPEASALAQLRADPRFGSIRTLGISNVTNLAAGIAHSVPSSDEVIQAGPIGGAQIIRVLREMLPEL
jgi:purine-nucleoside phosphorylase